MPQRNSVEYNVYFNGVVTPLVKPIHIQESAGAEKLDIATLEYKNASLQGFSPSTLLNLEVEIQEVATAEVVHWGKVTQIPILISSESGETLEIVSRTELYHLGSPVDGYLVWDPTSSETDKSVLIDGDLVFNPMIDGIILGNKNDTHTTAGGCTLLLDPESVRTTAAQTLQGANVERFTLSGAVFYLLWALNTPQTYISNPDQSTLDDVFDDPTALVQDVRIPRGTFLPQALDILLEPLGYRWRVKRTALGARIYEFFKKGTGGELVSVFHQAFGESLSDPRDLAEQNVDTAGITFDISKLANQVTIRGGFEEYEITVELARGWKESADSACTSASADNYAKDASGFEDVRDVLRKWVLNEAGDYIGSRTEITGIFTSALRTQLNSVSILHHFIARRRKLLPTLTLKDAADASVHDQVPIGALNGVEVEYSNTSDPIWLPCKGMDCELLQQEAGVYFNGEKLPEEFFLPFGNFDDLRIRVTATIQGDYRLYGFIDRQADSPNADNVPLVLDLPDRFRYRIRHSSLSKYGGGSVPSTAVNESTAIADFAGSVRDVFDVMEVSGPIQLDGLDHTYEVGDRVEHIYGKGISFLCRTSSGIYPQIVAIERNIDQQLTVLHLERQRDVLQLPAAPRGNTPRFRPRHSSRDFV